MTDKIVYVIKREDGQYFHRLLGWQGKQAKASRVQGELYAKMTLINVKTEEPSARLVRLKR